MSETDRLACLLTQMIDVSCQIYEQSVISLPRDEEQQNH